MKVPDWAEGLVTKEDYEKAALLVLLRELFDYTVEVENRLVGATAGRSIHPGIPDNAPRIGRKVRQVLYNEGLGEGLYDGDLERAGDRN